MSMSEAKALFATLRDSTDPAAAAAIERHVNEARDRDLHRINVFDFAARYGLNEEVAIGAFLHAARTVCRRAERAIIALQADDLPDTVIPYVNRLSDWLFVCARLVNRRAGVEERRW